MFVLNFRISRSEFLRWDWSASIMKSREKNTPFYLWTAHMAFLMRAHWNIFYEPIPRVALTLFLYLPLLAHVTKQRCLRRTSCTSMACSKICVELFPRVLYQWGKKHAHTPRHVENYLILQFFGRQTIFVGFIRFLSPSNQHLLTCSVVNFVEVFLRCKRKKEQVKRCENRHCINANIHMD